MGRGNSRASCADRVVKRNKGINQKRRESKRVLQKLNGVGKGI